MRREAVSRQMVVILGLSVVIGAAYLAPCPAAAQDLWLTNVGFPSDLYKVDLMVNEATFVTELTLDTQVHALAACPGETSLLVIGRNNGRVGFVDVDTDPPTEVILGTLDGGVEDFQVVQMTCAPDGTIFFTNNRTENLFTLDLSTCDPTLATPCLPDLMGTVETSPGAGDVDIQGADIQLSAAGDLYLATNGPLFFPEDRLLYRLDLSGGLPCPGLSCAATLIGNLATGANIPGLTALADGRMILSSNDDHIYHVDETDASLVDLGTLVDADTMALIDLRGGDLTARSAVCLPTIDFELDAAGNPLVPGQIIDDEFAGYGITVTTGDPINHPLMIFDTGAPTGNDPDLGTPNVDFGGPGIGTGGGAGEPGRNGLLRGQVLIISGDGDSGDPDDHAFGGQIDFLFDPPAPQLTEVHILDVDADQAGGTVRVFDAMGMEILSRPLLTLGNNSFQVVPVGAYNVARLEISLTGSGAVSGIVFCAPCGAVLAGEPTSPGEAYPGMTREELEKLAQQP